MKRDEDNEHLREEKRREKRREYMLEKRDEDNERLKGKFLSSFSLILSL